MESYFILKNLHNSNQAQMDFYFSFQVCSLAKEKIPCNQRSHFVKRIRQVFFQFGNFVVWGLSLVEAFWKDDAKEAACWKTTRSPSSVLFVFRSCGCDFCRFCGCDLFFALVC